MIVSRSFRQRPVAFVTLLAALVTAVSLVGCPGPQDKPDETPTEGPGFGERMIRYEIERVDDGQALSVRVTFLGAKSGETTFLIPSDHAGQRALYKGIRNFDVEQESVTVRETNRQNQRILEHEPRQLLNVRYEVVQTFEGEYRQNRFRPILDASGAYFLGGGVFGHPQRMHIGLERPIELVWNGLSDGESVVDSFGRVRPGAGTRQSLKTAIGAIQKAVYLVGEVSAASASVEGSTVRIASLGTLPARPGGFKGRIVEMIRAQREFFGDLDQPTYTVAIFGVEGCCWSVGDSVYRGFASLLAQKQPRAAQSHLVQLIAHEHLHHWIPDSMGSPRPFRAYMWFNEGFTEYFSRQFKLRTEVYTFETYVSRVNQMIEKYWNSSERNANRTQVQEGFGRRPPLTQLAYQRGHLLALNWNARIAAKTGGEKSLDDVALALVDRREADEKFRISDETLAATVKEVAGIDVSSSIDRAIDEGKTVEIEENALGPCAEFVPSEDGVPPRFEYAASKAKGTDCSAWFR